MIVMEDSQEDASLRVVHGLDDVGHEFLRINCCCFRMVGVLVVPDHSVCIVEDVECVIHRKESVANIVTFAHDLVYCLRVERDTVSIG